MAISTIIHRSSVLPLTLKNYKDEITLKQRIFQQMVREYDSYMTIKAMVTKILHKRMGEI